MWREIPGFTGDYQASASGEVRSRWSGRKRTDQWRTLTPHVRRRKASAPLYAFVYLVSPTGRRVRRSVHGCVLSAFCGPRQEGQECRHLNGDSLDNRLENLAWGTGMENHADRVRHGRIARRDRSGNGKLTERDAIAISVMRDRGMSTYELARWFGVNAATIGRSSVAALEAAP